MRFKAAAPGETEAFQLFSLMMYGVNARPRVASHVLPVGWSAAGAARQAGSMELRLALAAFGPS